MNRPLIPIINDATIGMSFDARPLTSDIQRLAVFYRDALGEEFPQHLYHLTFSEPWVYLRVFDNVFKNTIIYVEFLDSCIRIMYGREDCYINYSDPEFTEDIISKRLAKYEHI